MTDDRLQVFWHEAVLLHDTGSGLFEVEATPLVAEPERHPENAHRVRNLKDPLAFLPDDPTRADEGITAVRVALGRFWRF